MLNSKLIEFQNLAQKPYPVSATPNPSSQNLFAGGNTNAPVVNNGFSSKVSNFSQLSGLLNTRYEMRQLPFLAIIYYAFTCTCLAFVKTSCV